MTIENEQEELGSVLLDMYEVITNHPNITYQMLYLRLNEMYNGGPEMECVTTKAYDNMKELFRLLGPAPDIINANNVLYLMRADPRVIAANLSARLYNRTPVFTPSAAEVELMLDKQLYLLGLLVGRNLLPSGEYLRKLSRYSKTIMDVPLPEDEPS